MPPADPGNQFELKFGSVSEFDRAFERNGSDTGIFVQTRQAIGVGQRVSLHLSVNVKGIKSPVIMAGRVVWRRARAGGANLPAGLFVNLVARDRARLDALVRYMRGSQGRRDRRRHHRHSINLPAIYLTRKGEQASEIQNISRSGAFLRCMGPLLTVGASFGMVIYLEGKKSRGLALDARVAWIDYFEDTQGMGVEFVARRGPLKKIGRFIDRLEKSSSKSQSGAD